MMKTAVLILAAFLAIPVAAARADGTEDFFEGVKSYRAREFDDAAEWFRKAAEQGDGEAQFLLGRMHYDGNSIAVDYVQAHMWFDLAASSGVTVGARYRDGLSERMTREDIEEAQRRASNWRNEHPAAVREAN